MSPLRSDRAQQQKPGGASLRDLRSVRQFRCLGDQQQQGRHQSCPGPHDRSLSPGGVATADDSGGFASGHAERHQSQDSDPADDLELPLPPWRSKGRS